MVSSTTFVLPCVSDVTSPRRSKSFTCRVMVLFETSAASVIAVSETGVLSVLIVMNVDCVWVGTFAVRSIRGRFRTSPSISLNW